MHVKRELLRLCCCMFALPWLPTEALSMEESSLPDCRHRNVCAYNAHLAVMVVGELRWKFCGCRPVLSISDGYRSYRIRPTGRTGISSSVHCAICIPEAANYYIVIEKRQCRVNVSFRSSDAYCQTMLR